MPKPHAEGMAKTPTLETALRDHHHVTPEGSGTGQRRIGS